jgi:pimeloyl-ACP methyl ester carboxylesterase
MFMGIVLAGGILIELAAVPGPVFSDGPRATMPTGTADRSLSLLVQQYLDDDEPENADRLLAEILRDPNANVETVTAIIKAGRVYGLEPVGLQPSQPVQVRGRTYGYGLSVPQSYQPSQAYGLVVCLHGAGFTGDAYLERWRPRLGEDYLLACPTLPSGAWWTRQAEDLVLATIRSVEAQYHVDPDRIFLTGMSNGGIGTYLIGMHHASLFAGLAPMASGLDGVLLPFLENLRHTPLYIIHGRNDQVMPVELSRSIVKEMGRLGYEFTYREHEWVHPMAGGHFFPREELPALVAWFGSHRRDPAPKSLTVVRDATHLTSLGWVRIDATDRIAAFTNNLIDDRNEAVVNRVYARLEAVVVVPNRIEVRTRLVKRYSLFLNRALVDMTKPVTIVTNGRVSYQGPVTPSLETLLREARLRRDRHRLFSVIMTIAVETEP